jgi:hypothetical protein
VTVSGFTICSCFNGTFTLTKDATTGHWISPPITGCPGEVAANAPWYIAFTGVDLVVHDQYSEGQGASSCPIAFDCAPFQASGGRIVAGNINTSCSDSGEVDNMRWTISP